MGFQVVSYRLSSSSLSLHRFSPHYPTEFLSVLFLQSPYFSPLLSRHDQVASVVPIPFVIIEIVPKSQVAFYFRVWGWTHATSFGLSGIDRRSTGLDRMIRRESSSSFLGVYALSPTRPTSTPWKGKQKEIPLPSPPAPTSVLPLSF